MAFGAVSWILRLFSLDDIGAMRRFNPLLRSLLFLFSLAGFSDVFAQRGRPGGPDKDIERRVEKNVDKKVEQGVARGVQRQVERQVDQGLSNQVNRQLRGNVDKKLEKQTERSLKATLNVPNVAVNVRGSPGRALQKKEALERGNAPGKNKQGIKEAGLKKGSSAKNNDSFGKNGNAAKSQKKGKKAKLAKTNGKRRAIGQLARAENVSETPPYALERYHQIDLDQDGDRYLRNQHLVMLSMTAFNELEDLGLSYRQATPLNSFGQVLVEFDQPDMPDLSVLSQVLNAPLLTEAKNHIYQYQRTESDAARTGAGWEPYEGLTLAPLPQAQRNPRIGVIDSSVDLAHPSLREARITGLSFIESGLEPLSDHGTAVSSVLVGNSKDYRGLLPNAEILAAGVFYRTEEGDAASIKSILLALDWLLRAEVDAINMSLAGPANPLLERALKMVADSGVVVIAAAGNNGPGAPPAYPAAYPEVLAVTAIDQQEHVYFRANRGAYIDFAAPGVAIRHASSGGGFDQSSGTSYAVPFVTAAVAVLLDRQGPGDTVASLRANAIDLGDPDFDEVFGYGRIYFSR